MPSPARLADLTTFRVGGPVGEYLVTGTEQQLIDAVRQADLAGTPVLVLGGGSNLLASDAGFGGLVVRDGRRGHRLLTEHGCDGVMVNVVAGQDLDEFVAQAVRGNWTGLEALSGIPGTVGAAPVQNVGAYGQEVSHTVAEARVFDRLRDRVRVFTGEELRFGYRTSLLKASLADPRWAPTPRFVVLDVTFRLRPGRLSLPVRYAELAARLGIVPGARVPTRAVREAVLALRAEKGMLLDGFERLRRAYDDDAAPAGAEVAGGSAGVAGVGLTRDGAAGVGPAGVGPARVDLAGVVPEGADQGGSVTAEAGAGQPDHDRWSAGSFFTNPLLTPEVAASLPADAPRFEMAGPAAGGDGAGEDGARLVKTSAAWLLRASGFQPGYGVHGPGSRATLSHRHALALTNRGGATAADLHELAEAVRAGVRARFGIGLEQEPVDVG